MKERVVDTREYVSILRGIAEEGKVVSLRIAGSSMSPFLCHERDWIYFTRPDRALRRGDMVFYQRDTGQYVMHRIYQIRGKEYYMLGDAQTCVEGPLRREQIFCPDCAGETEGKNSAAGEFLVGIFRARMDPHTAPASSGLPAVRCFLRFPAEENSQIK